MVPLISHKTKNEWLLSFHIKEIERLLSFHIENRMVSLMSHEKLNGVYYSSKQINCFLSFHTFFQLHFSQIPTAYRTHSTFAETTSAKTYIEFPRKVPASYPQPVRTPLEGVRPSRQAHLQCPLQVHGTREYTGGVQHPVVWPGHYYHWGLPPAVTI